MTCRNRAIARGLQSLAPVMHLRLVAAVVAIAIGLASRTALAAPPACTTLPNPLVIESGDTQEPLLKTLGQKLANAATPMTVVYNLTGSCTLTQDVYSGKKLAVNLSYVPSANDPNAPGWDPSKPSPQCTIDPSGQPIDLAISALFVESCNLGAPPAGIIQIKGPEQGYSFVTNPQSTQQAIVAEEGYFVFGFGMTGQIAPWTDETQLFIRPPTKSTLLSLAANIRVPGPKWKGVPLDKSTQVVNAVAMPMTASLDSVLGILGTEVYDANRQSLKVLAYRAYGQHHAWFPDSDFTSHDKRNLRDGHYTLWSPTVYLGGSSDGTTFSNANAQRFMDLVLGNVVEADVNGLDAVIAKGLVPDCAMKVKRDTDGGDLSLYTPAAPCGCYFESKVPNGSTSCTACTDDGPCNGGKCRHGFCEAQ